MILSDPESVQNFLKRDISQVQSISFPNISTGVYRFPKELAAKIAIDEVHTFLAKNQSIKKVYFVCFDDENYEHYSDILLNTSS